MNTGNQEFYVQTDPIFLIFYILDSPYIFSEKSSNSQDRMTDLKNCILTESGR